MSGRPVSFFLLLFALMAALANSWRYAIGFAAAAVALPAVFMAIDYWTYEPTTAREVFATCNVEKDGVSMTSVECIALIMENLAPPRQKDGRCVYDIAVFRTDPATIDPRVADKGGIEGWMLLSVMAVEWMNAHPEQLDLPASEVIGNAIASRFPCPANPG